MYEIKLANRNYTIMGIYENDDLSFSVTSVDFYNLFEYLSKFLNKPITYIKPKLYGNVMDITTNGGYWELAKDWSKYRLVLHENRIFSRSYGHYEINEISALFDAMCEYVCDTKEDMIFQCPSNDIRNIGYNPFSIYKSVYGESQMTIDLMLYFISIGEWHYMSKTLKDNLNYIYNKYDKILELTLNDFRFKLFENKIKSLSIEDKYKCFNLLNNYKVL
ncbi:hypothetical protein J6Q66_05275 [bacterium]|nr:hypothetical protein [bacterium]